MSSEQKGYSLYHAGLRAEIDQRLRRDQGMSVSASDPGLRGTRRKKKPRRAIVPKLKRAGPGPGPLTAENLALRLDRMNKLVESTLSGARPGRSDVLRSPIARKLLPSIDAVELKGAQKKGLEKRIISEVDDARDGEGPASTVGAGGSVSLRRNVCRSTNSVSSVNDKVTAKAPSLR